MHYYWSALISLGSSLLIFIGLLGIYSGASNAFQLKIEFGNGLAFLGFAALCFLLNALIWHWCHGIFPWLTFRRGVLLGACSCWLLGAFWFTYWCVRGVSSKYWEAFAWCQSLLLLLLVSSLPLVVWGFVHKATSRKLRTEQELS
ncbi:MAG: hypothetical protein RR060_01365 [Victivallaceae bacterium]